MSIGLCQTFRDLADQTRERIELAHAAGLSWSEESNTELILLTLRTKHPKEIAIASFSKRVEARVGADWEWWFVGPSGAYGMRVQAKRIKLPTEIFSHLYYTPKGHVLDQMTSLIDCAMRDGLAPAYCFYVASRLKMPIKGQQATDCIGGCFIGHAQSVQRIQSNALFLLAPHLMPWHLLVCDCVSGSSGDLATSAEAAIRSVIGKSAPANPAFGDTGSDILQAFAPEVRKTVPGYVARLLEESLDRISVDSVLKESGALDRGVRGIVVFRKSG